MKATVNATCPRCGMEISMEDQQRDVDEMRVMVGEAVRQHKTAVRIVNGQKIDKPNGCTDVEIAIEVRA